MYYVQETVTSITARLPATYLEVRNSCTET
ncbi:hypothetical protein Rcae01_04695 [Novipirellula caenicola]|uniref:Uncharacterized protein n=1 Tax=Novipirellula caenicola TaxID=1536901 RepID=A0ABP9VZ99_9BACT